MPRKTKVVKVVKVEEIVESQPVVESEPQPDEPQPIEPVEISKVVKLPRKVNPWLVHVKTVKDANPTISYRDILKLAKETYTKK